MLVVCVCDTELHSLHTHTHTHTQWEVKWQRWSVHCNDAVVDGIDLRRRRAHLLCVCECVYVCVCVARCVCVLPSWGLAAARFCTSTLWIKVKRKMLAEMSNWLNPHPPHPPHPPDPPLVVEWKKKSANRPWWCALESNRATSRHLCNKSVFVFENLLETSEISRIAATTESKAVRHVDAGDEPNPSRRSRNMMGYNQGYNKLFTQVPPGVDQP